MLKGSRDFKMEMKPLVKPGKYSPYLINQIKSTTKKKPKQETDNQPKQVPLEQF